VDLHEHFIIVIQVRMGFSSAEVWQSVRPVSIQWWWWWWWQYQ